MCVCGYFSWYFTATDLKTVYLSQAIALWAFCSFYLLFWFLIYCYYPSFNCFRLHIASHLHRMYSTACVYPPPTPPPPFRFHVTIAMTTIIFHHSWFLALFCQCSSEKSPLILLFSFENEGSFWLDCIVQTHKYYTHTTHIEHIPNTSALVYEKFLRKLIY